MAKDKKLIILGAGKPESGDVTTSLISEPNSSKTLLDWQLAFARQIFTEIIYVAGYGSDELTQKYQDLTIVENRDWQTTGPLGSLKCVYINPDIDYVIQYGDVLFMGYPHQISQINSENLIIFHDKDLSNSKSAKEQVCYYGEQPLKFGYDIFGSKKRFELCGLIGINGGKLLQLLKADSNKTEKESLSFLPELQRLLGGSVQCYPVDKNWFEINSNKDFARQVLGTKAETLSRLRGVLSKSSILDQLTVQYDNWRSNSDDIVVEIFKKFGNSKLVIRSSAKSEDGFSSAFAGVFESLLDVQPKSKDVRYSINHVFNSYGTPEDFDQVLIQPMLTNVTISGVVFTRTIDNGAPYITINYDDKSGLTDTVTGGSKVDLSTLKIFKNSTNLHSLETWQANLVDAIREIENYLQFDELDIEFGIDEKSNLYIFQVRPLAALKANKKVSDEQIKLELERAKKQFNEFVSNKEKPLFAKMPDWNPAEIIGTRPNQLAYSLYAAIITDRTWAQQRFENGNIDMRGDPLMFKFCGQPYINVLSSIKSFIPSQLDRNIQEKIIRIATQRYRDNPHLHDKLEFEILPTCFETNTSKWKNIYTGSSNGLSDDEFESWMESLKLTTQNQIQHVFKFISLAKEFDVQLEKINELEMTYPVKIRKLLHILEQSGTLAFAHLARCGFISVSIIRSMVVKKPSFERKAIEFQSSIKTVSTRYTEDVHRLLVNEITRDQFLTNYGHLRPETYNIYSQTYNETIDSIIPKTSNYVTNKSSIKNNFDIKNELYDLSNELNISVDRMEEFLRLSIEWREEAKYIFTKGLSLILEILKAKNPGSLYSRKLIHYLKITEILSFIDGDIDIEVINTLINSRRENESFNNSTELPAILNDEIDFEFFFVGIDEINFVGNSSVRANIVEVTPNNFDISINDKIVFIESADPGYDWIFGHNILGLITEYGGSNSHMAIRAAEYGIPAAIGIGQRNKDKLQKFTTIEIDCRNKRLKGIH